MRFILFLFSHIIQATYPGFRGLVPRKDDNSPVEIWHGKRIKGTTDEAQRGYVVR